MHIRGCHSSSEVVIEDLSVSGRRVILNEPIYKAMLLKESFLGIYEHKKEINIKQYLENWLKDAAASGLPAFKCLAISFKEKMESNRI